LLDLERIVLARARGSENTRRARAARSAVPPGARNRSPKRAMASSSPSPGTSSTAREWASRSITRWPAARQIAATVDLPEPMPPVRPRRTGVEGLVMGQSVRGARPAPRRVRAASQLSAAARRDYGAGVDPLELLVSNDLLRVLDL